MRLDIFEELAPVCPVCRAERGADHPLVVALAGDMRSGRLWHGMLHCSNRDCWREFPVIDGVPVITPDPAAFLQGSAGHVLMRGDLPDPVMGAVSEAQGAGSDHDTIRQHLSIYAGEHYADWAEPARPSSLPAVIAAGLEMQGPLPPGPAIDIGTSVGRGAWEAGLRLNRTVLGCDLNFSMLRLAQSLALEGRAVFGRRRIGMVYDPVQVVLPADFAAARADFWAADALALPFAAGRFALALAINVVDCVPAPTDLLAQMARVLAAQAGAVICTPYDWAPGTTSVPQWFGGHSQRGDTAGAGEPVLRATLAHVGLPPVAERDGLAWRLRLHQRAVMHYDLHLLACRKA
jgi:SAM-dependent methyltransferase/uncharacterized protein YbaR (Trm112 family)